MKAFKSLFLGLAGAVLFLAPCALRAQSFEPVQFLSLERLNVHLTALVQGDTVDIENNGAVVGTRDKPPTRIRIDNKGLLAVLGAPLGARLVLIDGNSVGVRVGTADPVPTGISLEVEAPDVVISKGRQTDTTTDTKEVSRSKYTAKYVSTVSVEGSDLPDNSAGITGFSFSLTGLTTETARHSDVTGSTTSSTARHSFLISGAGNGSITMTNGESSVVVSGHLSTRGKEQ